MNVAIDNKLISAPPGHLLDDLLVELDETGVQVETKRDTVRIKIASFSTAPVDQNTLKPDFITLVHSNWRHLLGQKISLQAVSEKVRFDPHRDQTHLV